MFRPAPVLLLAGAAWTTLVVAAPIVEWPAIYTAAHLVCHQIPERSFHLASGPLAVCARCLGLYAGAVIGGAGALLGPRSEAAGPAAAPGRARFVLALAAVPMLLTVVAEWLLRWPVTNLLRFSAAAPLGIAAAWVVTRALEVDWRT